MLHLPRELRDMIYAILWDFGYSHHGFLRMLLDIRLRLSDWYAVEPAPRCAQARHSIPSCVCLRGVPRFLDPGLAGHQISLEILSVYQQEYRKRMEDDRRAEYSTYWEDMEGFATRDVFHLGLTLHEVQTDYHLTIHVGCLEDMGLESTLDIIGIPRKLGKLDRSIEALHLLSKQQTRPITFALQDNVEKRPSNLEYVLRKLSVPFHRLHRSGFDVTVTYENGPRGNHHGLGKWRIGKDGWGSTRHPRDVWTWNLNEWNLHFTRSNEDYHPTSMWCESFYPNPNGLIARYFSGTFFG
jgi:hypothetical protein